MHIYLPIAEMSVPVEAILMLGVAVGFLSGVFGVGGGFLATPFLMFLGVPPAIAVGTQANQLVAASLSGVLGHMRRGDVDFKMGSVMLGGSFFGSVLGVLLFGMLKHFGQIDLIIPLLYIVLLGVMGTMMLWESLSSLLRRQESRITMERLHNHPFFRSLPYKTRFPRSRLYISALLPAGIGFIGGLLVSVMGIGGGFLMIPAMIYILGMPTLLVAGTTLFQILITTVLATVMHASLNHSVDLVLGFLLIVGGVVGAHVGIRVARRIKGGYARLALAVLLLLVAFELSSDLLIRPLDLYTTVMR